MRLGAVNVKKLTTLVVHTIPIVELPGNPLCPVAAVIRMLTLVGAIKSEKVFRSFLSPFLLLIKGTCSDSSQQEFRTNGFQYDRKMFQTHKQIHNGLIEAKQRRKCKANKRPYVKTRDVGGEEVQPFYVVSKGVPNLLQKASVGEMYQKINRIGRSILGYQFDITAQMIRWSVASSKLPFKNRIDFLLLTVYRINTARTKFRGSSADYGSRWSWIYSR